MTARRDYVDYIRDMLEAAERAKQFVEGLDYESFVGDTKTVFAVVRALEVLGKASKKIPKSVRDKHPKIPWKEISGMRDRLIHGYFGVELEVVWKTVREDLPTLWPQLELLLLETEQGTRD